LQTLLNLSTSLGISLGESNLRGDSLGDIGDRVVCQAGTAGGAALVILDLPFDESIPDATQSTAVVSPSLRTDLSVVAMLGAALALGQLWQTGIQDDACLFSINMQIDPFAFPRDHKLDSPQEDAESAARRFLAMFDLA
jgi:hypothetical protein